ncbi:RHS repeat-associated core domain-containing protein [Runella sp. SP2]|uniref:scabin-related ADP-ribosyltransferase n=1 Tax=Runella sp. SP2 TaxID=2268026 RepID=UPI0019823327|nr:RHS repeat-associated core domain-containing protein [Runella sp. SP2]
MSGQGEVLQRNDYYAFGLAIDAVDRGENKYLFLNRELQPETGSYDLIHRQYDPAKARFDAVDPKPDDGDQESLSTYQYGLNNPILRSDPNGDCTKCWEAIKSWLTAPISPEAQKIGQAYMISSTGLDSKPKNRWQLIAAVMGHAGQHFGGSTPGNLKIRIPKNNTPKINISSKSIPKKGDFIFRGDERGPDLIFNEGFKSKGDNTNLEQHVKYNPDDDAYISTTKYPKISASGDYGEYVYTIKDPKTGKDVNQELGQGRFSYEHEIAIPYLIPSQNIKGVRKVGNAGKFTGPFIKNPNYQLNSQ